MQYENEVIINYGQACISIFNGKARVPYYNEYLKSISEMKGYKHFADDCIRFSSLDIVEYLVELTYDSVLEWDNVFGVYISEYGDEKYQLEGNNLRFNVNDYLEGDFILGNLKRLYKAIQRKTPGSIERISIYDLVVKCHHKEMNGLKANLIPVDAYLLVENKERLIKAYYSKDQDEYFVYRREIENIGQPYCRVISYSNYIKNRNQNYDFYDLNPQSIMYTYGYNVSDNKTDKERRAILVFLMESKIMTWSEIISHLEFLIDFHGRKGNTRAVSIWNSDIDYIRLYKNSNKNRVIIDSKYF